MCESARPCGRRRRTRRRGGGEGGDVVAVLGDWSSRSAERS